MARFGNGYGSECHLFRYLGRHRERLNTAVCDAIGADALHWLDFPFQPIWPSKKAPEQWPDAEWLSLDFLPQESPVVREWRERWPHGRGVMNWDAVGEVEISGQREWLLVEAKAHLGEIRTDCGAESDNSKKRIARVFDETKKALGAASEADWMKRYYQYANRLAVLHHLSRHNISAHLLFVYFCGDRPRGRATCPRDESGWRDALIAQDDHIGLPARHALSLRIHKLFLPVWFDPARA